MRFRATLAVAFLLSTSALPACASGLDNKSPDMDSILALESRASQAQPREQCPTIYQQEGWKSAAIGSGMLLAGAILAFASSRGGRPSRKRNRR